MLTQYLKNNIRKPLFNPGTKLLVCDMAGTLINEQGIIYESLYKCLKNNNMDVKKEDIVTWHGMKKEEVISNVVSKSYKGNKSLELTSEINNELISLLNEEYFNSSKIKLIHPKLPEYLTNLRNNNIKIALNTGYTSSIQKSLIHKFNMKDYIDDYICGDDVNNGRPYPYMIFKLMERNNIINVKDVVKIVDTKNDILEGKNAGCGQVISVLSGAENIKQLEKYKPDIIVENITDIKLNK